MSDITSMGLYQNVERVEADLAAAGHEPGSLLTVADLTGFDQYHYEGTDAVDDAIAALGIGALSNILDVGSGLGGPARYIADRTGARVTALEIQPGLDEIAASLTRRCGLDKLVTHINGDVLAGDSGVGEFTGLVSMLCVLHIPDRERLFARCFEALKPGATIFIDDYVALGKFTPDEREGLAEKVFCSYVPGLDTYVRDVRSAGFTGVKTVYKTADWTAFVTDRLAAFRAKRSDLVSRYGVETVDSLEDFYSTVAGLFTAGHLGGLRLTAVR